MKKSQLGAFRLNFAPLRARRRVLEVSQEQLATVAGVSPQSVLRMESGTRPEDVTVHELVAYSRALGVPLMDLFKVENVRSTDASTRHSE